MPMKSSADVAKKWSQNLGAAGPSIKAGVMAVTVNPAEQAAARQDAYIQGVQNAVTSGKYRRGLARVTLQSWQQAMNEKGLARIAQGASAAVPKFQRFMDSWLPYQQQLQQKLASMPRGDLQTNIQRAITAIQHNAAWQGQ